MIQLRRNEAGLQGWRTGFELFRRLWGFEHTLVLIKGRPYLERWILYVAGYTLRLHKFWRGDDDRASHTHPWWFITFPLAPYRERVFHQGWERHTRVVLPFRPHYRPPNFEHIVVDRMKLVDCGFFELWEHDDRPCWTIVITGRRQNAWGFYPKPGTFVPWREWK